jgi:hypothetical protein
MKSINRLNAKLQNCKTAASGGKKQNYCLRRQTFCKKFDKKLLNGAPRTGFLGFGNACNSPLDLEHADDRVESFF